MKIEQGFTPCFELNGIVYVPHYLDGHKGLYVGPGFWEPSDRSPLAPPPYKYSSRKYTDYELTQAGAKVRMEVLWSRKRG